jgi:hypothetical protein
VTRAITAVLHNLTLHELAGRCRSCRGAISRSDEFGASEGVCRACRAETHPPTYRVG